MATAPGSMTEEGKVDRVVVALKKPSLHSMVLEALAGNKDKKGMTIQGIKKAVIKQYPDTQENFSNKRLQNALKKGLDSSEVIRPKSSEEEGFKGYFLLNRALAAQKEKKKKEVKTAAKRDDTEKSKKQLKVKVQAAKPGKAEQSKPSKGNKSSAKTTKAMTTKVKETSIKSKVAKKKKPLVAKSSNASNKSTPKTPKRRVSITATPKLSKADRTKAGVSATKGRRVK